ncbi:MAG: mucoidy inhibitor MuiA family protein [Sedimentisphaerales bacterium]|nr:mucoidy inhibitor MuiA family protein [Sedimentisphaerales bacterium]
MNANKVLPIIVSFAVFASIASLATAGPVMNPGKITEVTVYRGQALVTRQIDLELPAGLAELVVTDLPARILPESLYAQTDDQRTKVLSVRYRQQAVEEETRKEVRQIDRQLEELRQQLKHVTARREMVQSQWQLFERLKDFTVSAEKVDLGRGLLTFEPLRGLTGLIEQKGEEYLNRRLELEDKIEELNKRADLLQRQRAELVAGRSRTERQALVAIEGPGGRVKVRLSYLVQGANWQPQYNLRAEPVKSNVVIEYIAVVNQTSGEDWDDVLVSLSTAEPTMVASPPVLEPMQVGLSGVGMQMVQQMPAVPQAEPEQLRSIISRRQQAIGKGKAATDELNRLALQNQLLEFSVVDRQVEQLQRQMAEIARVEGVSVTYELPGRLTLPSRADQQIVSIATIGAKGQFTLIACPLLTDYVYLQADVVNSSQTILLPGPAAIFRDGQFVGRADMSLVTMGERFTAGFGIDSQIQVRRELEEKTTRIQGGNRIDTFRYRLAINNYKDSAVGLRVLDRLPYAEEQAIRIDLDKVDPPLSSDPEYLRTQHKKGILRWDIELGPRTIDDKATVITYTYKMEYDRNMRIEPKGSGN